MPPGSAWQRAGMTGIEIAKAAVDIGIATNRTEDSRRFWTDEIGLRYDHLLKVGGGVHQHRYELHGAVLKLNSHRDPLGTAPTGLLSMRTVAHVDEPAERRTPDGTPVTLVPAGHDGIVASEVTLAARDARSTAQLFADALGFDRTGTDAVLGETRIRVVSDPGREPTGARDGVGMRYLTVQVRDVGAAHQHAVDRGLREGLAPIRLGDTAAISFVRLPDGDWVELSQRVSLTGPLPHLS